QNLDGYLNYKLNNYRNLVNNFKLDYSNTVSNLANHRAYKLEFTSNYNGINKTIIETGTIIGSKVYYINVIVDTDQYSKYLPMIQKMIDTFQVGSSNDSAINTNNINLPSNFLSYKNPEFGGIEMNYPVNWLALTNNSNPSSFVIFAPSGSL